MVWLAADEPGSDDFGTPNARGLEVAGCAFGLRKLLPNAALEPLEDAVVVAPVPKRDFEVFADDA